MSRFRAIKGCRGAVPCPPCSGCGDYDICANDICWDVSGFSPGTVPLGYVSLTDQDTLPAGSHPDDLCGCATGGCFNDPWLGEYPFSSPASGQPLSWEPDPCSYGFFQLVFCTLVVQTQCSGTQIFRFGGFASVGMSNCRISIEANVFWEHGSINAGSSFRYSLCNHALLKFDPSDCPPEFEYCFPLVSATPGGGITVVDGDLDLLQDGWHGKYLPIQGNECTPGLFGRQGGNSGPFFPPVFAGDPCGNELWAFCVPTNMKFCVAGRFDDCNNVIPPSSSPERLDRRRVKIPRRVNRNMVSSKDVHNEDPTRTRNIIQTNSSYVRRQPLMF